MTTMYRGYRRTIAWESSLSKAKAMCDGSQLELGPWCPGKGGYAIIRPANRAKAGRPPRKLTPEQERVVFELLDEQDQLTRRARALEIEFGIEFKEYRRQKMLKKIAQANRQINATRDARLRLTRRGSSRASIGGESHHRSESKALRRNQ